MNIIKQKWEFLNSTSDLVPKKIKKLYQFGISILVFRQITSLRSNSRLLDLNWHTAKSKAYRIANNEKILQVFPGLIKELSIVRKKDILAVDFSDFNGMQVLMFAKQTKKGRTIPIYFEVLTYPIKKDSQNLFVIRAIENLTNFIGFRPKLVFDRGFACPSIIKYLAKNKHLFIIRIKKCKLVINSQTGELLKVKDSLSNDLKVLAYDKKLRIVISDKLENVKEPWYLVTNDFKTKRENIIKEYYYRFEIEEFFRDAKRLLGLEYVNFKKSQSLSVVLWFLILGVWFVMSLDEKQKDLAQRFKMKLSKIRYYFEMMQREIFLATEGQYLVDS